MAEVNVEGLAAFRKALKQLDPEAAKEFRDRMVDIAQHVAADARGRVPSRTGTARSSVRGGMAGNRGYIQGGKAAVPYFGWLDFGSRTPNRGQPRSVGPWKGSGAGPTRGRYIYPAIDSNRSRIETEAAKAAEEVAERVLPK